MNKLKKLHTQIHAWAHYNPPGALTGPGWSAFDREFKKIAPIRYWYQHNFKDATVRPIKRIHLAITEWIYCHLQHRYHIVKTGLKPGYQELDNIMLYANFNLLKDYVECEVSLQTAYCRPEESAKLGWKREYIPFYNSIFPYRNPELGLSHLKWIIEDSIKHSVVKDERAVEIIELYNWWTVTRMGRVEIKPVYPGVIDPNDIFGNDIDVTTKEYATYKEMAAAAHDQYDNWYDEDTEYLVRLMKIRRHLWT